MKRRYRLYCETSYWKRLGDAMTDGRRRVSYRFLRAVAGRHQLLLSRLVLQEIALTSDLDERRHILRRIESVRHRMVTNSRRAERMALELLAVGGWSEELFADLLHVSYTILSGAEALVTWDAGDLARDRTRLVVQAYARRSGLAAPLIGTPEEVAKWLGMTIR